MKVESYVELWQAVYYDACQKCSADVSDLRDLVTLRWRVKKEGISFLTISLPQFARDLEQALASGGVLPAHFRGYEKRGAIPVFLQGMLGVLFDRETGRCRGDSPDVPTVVEAIRQVCVVFKKLRLACSPKAEARAIKRFISTETELQRFSLDPRELQGFLELSSVLWASVFNSFSVEHTIPRHGPGATAERISGNQKFSWQRWHERLEPWFPFLGYGLSANAAFSTEFERVSFLSEDKEPPVRVVFVPKTLKSPRVIAIEPVCMQYAQQGLMHVLTDAVESSAIAGGHVNFRDQSVNQALALASSADGSFSTIDLSDASDRVPWILIMAMVSSNPELREAIDACRSRRAHLPDGVTTVSLRKFASMGSALCFPMEALYFYTISVKALLDEQNLPYTWEHAFGVSRGVYVYGDDIIVPSTNADAVLAKLQKYNCKPSPDKTFTSGKFRESCGVDAYDGYEVTPTYLREVRPENRRQSSELISWVATANLFYSKGYWKTAALMFCTCESLLGPLPFVSRESQALGRITFLGGRSISRWNGELHYFEQKAWIPESVYRSDEIDGYSALQKSLLSLCQESTLDARTGTFSTPLSLLGLVLPGSDEFELERSARYGAAALKLRWVDAR